MQRQPDHGADLDEGKPATATVPLPVTDQVGGGTDPGDAPAPPANGTSRPAASREDPSTWVLGLGFWVVVGAVVAWNNDTARSFIIRWRWAIVAVGIFAVSLLLSRGVRTWLKQRTSTYRAGLFIFVVVPLLVALVGSVTVLPERYQTTFMRSVFLLTVCLLPATMWFLFIATRKASLLNDFLSNLDRLGLLAVTTPSRRGIGVRDTARDRRVASYLQRFEAAYGPLPAKVHAEVRNNKFVDFHSAEVATVTGLSTTTVPVILSTVLITVGWLITLPPVDAIAGATDPRRWVQAFELTATPFTLAFLGAYFFSLQMLFRRYVRRDLRGSAYVAVAMRIVLAMIGIWVVTVTSGELGLATEWQLLVAGFVIGVFPRVAWQLVQTAFKKTTRFVVSSMVSDLPVSDLDGLTVWHEARLEEEDIENIPNMATADLVDLLVNTRFPPDRIIDWVDQAILFTQLGAAGKGHRDALRARGIRSATSLLEASAASRARREHEAFAAILGADGGIASLPILESTLRANANLELIERWRGMAATLPLLAGPRPEESELAARPAEPEATAPRPVAAPVLG